MANSTWIQLTNQGLRQSGLPEIPDDGTTFNNPNLGLMTRYQICMREFIKITHDIVSVDLPVAFARRRFQLNINATANTYQLDSGMSVESITFNGFRNLSITPPGPPVLRNWTYEYFSSKYADPSLISSGAPTHYILLPPLRTDVSPIYRVQLFPNPDQAYSLEYIAQLNPYQLLLDTSPVLWPPEYEHIIILQARFELEDLLGEGKAGSLYAQAQKAYSKARQKATQPSAERKAIRMKKMFHRGAAFGYYNSPPDSDAPYNAPDTIR